MPPVADQPDLGVELSFFQNLPFVLRGTADDELERASLRGGGADL